MATDLERLVVSLDADITRLTKQLSKAGVAMDTTAKDLDTKSKRAAKAVNDNLGGVGGKGLNTNQFQILGHVARSSFEAIAAGASPLRVIAQEGVKASAAIGSDGLAGFLEDATASLAGLISPAAAAAAGVVAVGGAALYAASSVGAAREQIRIGLSGIGAASHATAADVAEIGDRLAETQKIGVGAGRDIALALARTGMIGVGNVEPVGNLARGLATLTGSDIAEAGKQLADIFSDPSKGAITLNALIGSLDDRTIQYVQTLQRQGDRQQAIAVLAAAAQPQLQKAAEKTSVWAAAWERLASGAAKAKNAVGGALIEATSGPTLEQQKGTLQDQLLRPQRTSLRNPQASVDAEYDRTIQKLTELNAKIEERDKLLAKDGEAKAAAALTTEAGAIVRAYDEAGQAIKNLEADLEHLGKGIAGSLSDPAQQIDGGASKAIESYGALKTRLDQLKTDYAAGGAAAAAALREADFAKQIAGASAYARGLAEINHRFDEQIIAARTAGNVKAIPTVEASRQAAVAAFGEESGERAKTQVSLPDGFARIVTGAEGNNAARNPLSSASGFGQFLDGTFIEQYRKEFSDLAATMNDAAILKLKGDFEVNQKLIEAYGRENAVKLTNAGFQATAQNLYLAHNYGSAGAIRLLSAAPGASATGILGQGVANANPAVAGRTAQQVIDEAATRSQRFSSAGRSQQDQIVAERASAEAVGKSAVETARLASIQEQLNADREKGGQLGQQFATAQDLIRASSDKLTPALAAQRQAVVALAADRAKAAQSGLNARFRNDLQESYSALGRTPEQQEVFERARTYADPSSAQFVGITDSLTKLHDATELKDESSSFVKGLVGDLIQGRSAAEALHDELNRVAEKALDKGIDAVLAGLFSGGAGGAGGAGFFASLFSGHADGGYIRGPGTGTSDSMLARLSNGEFVVNADATRRALPLLEAINGGQTLRFAQGGIVGRAPVIPGSSATAAAAGLNIQVINNHSGAAVGAQRTGTVNGRQTVQVMVEEALVRSAATNGRGFQAISRRSGLGRVGG